MLMTDITAKILAQKLLHIFYKHRRELNASTKCVHKNHNDCRAIHLNKIIECIQNRECINFILPAFPAKSSNKNKTVGPFPDLGERLALKFLNQLCEKIGSLYTPGAKIIICADGRVFNDLVMVSDTNVSLYTEEIEKIICEDRLSHLSTFKLDSYYQTLPYAIMRTNLVR